MATDKENEELHESDPTEEVGPDKAQVSPIECELRAEQLEGKAHESEVRIVDELHDAYQPNPKTGTADDGMPYADADAKFELAEAPAFTRDNVVCIEDTRKYVELFYEELLHEYSHENRMVLFNPRKKYDNDGQEIERLEFESFSGTAFGIKYAISYGKKIPVRPIRERCIHFREQLFANDDQTDPDLPGHKILFRNCNARKSVGGAALTVRDEAVFACSWREPRDLASEERFLDSFNRKLLAESEQENKVHLPLIDDD